jgi:O-methyltransferase involved in polyketide biosynthesis
VTGDGAAPAGEDSPGNGDPAGAAQEVPDFDVSVAHQARIYNYWIGGTDNFAADRQAAEQAMQAYPAVATGARANRQFLARAVRYLAGQGIRQFLDLGTGIPSANNTHEVARQVAPGSKVVYVDYDPVVLAHARTLLADGPPGQVDYLDADLRDTGPILERAAATLDFSQPVAIMLMAILHAIDDEDPAQVVRRLAGAVPPGSYVTLSHPASDIDPEKIAAATSRLNALSRQHFTLRTNAEVAGLFGELEILEPGVVRVEDWRPDPGGEPRYVSAMWGGVAVKR